MNILFLSRDYPPKLIGGVGIYVYEMSRSLAKMGHGAFVITEAQDTPLEYIDAGVRVFRVKIKGIKALDNPRINLNGILDRLKYSLAVSDKINELCKRYPIDIVESCEARAEGFWYYFLRRSPPLVIKLHTPETLAFKLDHAAKTLDYKLIKLLEEFWINRAWQIIGLSKEVIDLTEQHFRAKFKQVPLIPNPLDIDLFKPSLEPDNSELDILYVGRLEFRKGVHTLIRSMAYVQQYLPETKLTFIGADCGMKGYLLNKASQLKYPENILFVDQLPRDKLIEYYQKSTICVIPSIWENYPYVCLEAMACEKPIIASDIGGIKDMIINGHNGILVPPGSSKSLGEAIVNLLKDRHLRKKLGVNARESIEQNYTSEKIVQKTLNIYRSLLEKK
jgi:glycosyltransferase involved in cell wall biosynthesis